MASDCALDDPPANAAMDRLMLDLRSVSQSLDPASEICPRMVLNNDYARAVEECTRLISETLDLDTATLSVLHFVRAHAQIHLENLSNALKDLNAAIKFTDGMKVSEHAPFLHRSRAVVLTALGQLSAAYRDFAAASDTPSDVTDLMHAFLVHYEHRNDFMNVRI
jgi:hypothetical protein